MKTMKVEKIKAIINDRLKRTGSYEGRSELCMLLEGILMETNNYAGFQYLTELEVPEGERPGIRPDQVFSDTDDTRRRYL